MAELHPGNTASIEVVVGQDDLADRLQMDDSDHFPRVFATVRLIALLEVASSRIMQPLLGAGETSVGVDVQVAHLAPTCVGATVRATAHYAGREGKLFVFDIEASDRHGPICRGRHKRAIITLERFEEYARKRNAT